MFDDVIAYLVSYSQAYMFSYCYTPIMNHYEPVPTAPNTETETIFGVVFWCLNTFSDGIWSTRE